MKEEQNEPSPANQDDVSVRIHRALRHPYNLLALSAGVALTAALLQAWVIIATLVIEALYLAIMAARPSRQESGETRAGSKPEPSVRQPAGTKLKAQIVSRAAPSAVEPRQSKPGRGLFARALEPLAVGRKGGRTRANDGRSKLDSLSADAQERYLRLEATHRLITLQVAESMPVYHELPGMLATLMDRFILFATRQDELADRLESIAEEALALKRAQKLAPGVADLQLVSGASERSEAALETWVGQKLRNIHDGYERALGDIAMQRDRLLGDPETDLQLRSRGDTILKRIRHADKVAKTLINVYCELQLLDRKFDLVSQELSTRRPDHVISDVSALILQTQSLARSVDELEPMDKTSVLVAA
jgi:hypothetical protein